MGYPLDGVGTFCFDDDMVCKTLPLDDLRLSFGGGSGLCREELVERTESFSIGGGGVGDTGDMGDSRAVPSGNRGSS